MHWLPCQRKLYVETGARARAALYANGTAVLAHNAVCHREAQPGSFPRTFGCEKRIVDALQVLGRNALPAISYFDACEPVFVPGADGQRATVFHSVPRV